MVTNSTNEKVWISVDNVKIELQEISGPSSSSRSSSSSWSMGLELSRSASVEIPEVGGASSSASGGLNASNAQSESSSSASSSNRKFALSPFIEAGETLLQPGKTARIGVDNSSYYLSARTEKTILAANVRKITDRNRHVWIKGEQVQFVGAPITSGTNIHLTHSSTAKSLADPTHAYSLYHVAQVKDSAQLHRIEKVSGNGQIENGDIVRIVALKPLEKNRKYLFHGAYDNAYYEWDSKDKATHWRVGIINNEDDTLVLRSGSRLQLTGVAWNKMLTVEKKPDLSWVKAMPVTGAATHWTIEIR